MDKSRGFTLIELLVVIAIIAVLMAILMPSLNAVKEQARSIACRSNVRTLTQAWLMYKDENDGTLVYGGSALALGSWAPLPSDWKTCSIETKKEWLKKGALWSFIKKIDVYRCPSDRRKNSPYHKYAYRTYSIPGGMNGEGGEVVPCKNYSDIKGPVTKYVFLAECDPRGVNGGSWQLRAKSRTWVDPFGIWHNKNRNTMGFADGHVDMHRWNSATLTEWNELALWEPQKFSFFRDPTTGDEQELEDFEWVLKGYSYKALR